MCECLETEEILLYSLSIGNDNTPHVSLVKIQTPALNDSCCDDMFDMQSEIVSHDNTNNPTSRQTTIPHNKCDLASQDELVENTLKNFFNHQGFKPLQKEIIMQPLTVIKNVIGVLGTGGGKSLTFMLPAVLADKPTIVVVPTLSLIDDLLSRCLDLDITACKLTGEVPIDVRNSYLEEFAKFKLVFCTPEMFENQNVLDTIKSIGLERIVFDEAHTICSWGTTFRPQYRNAANELAKFPCPKLLLSATVPQQLILELSELFGTLKVVKGTVLRNNIFLSVQDKLNGSNELSQFILNKKDEYGIIYAVFQSDVSKIHSELLKRNVNCVKYHGQLSQSVKEASYQKWTSGEVKVMVANASFGMGVDKQNVRYVIHAKMPTNLDEYFQQCGRAGRDGQPSTRIMHYHYADRTALLKLFHASGDLARQSANLNNLVSFLEDPVTCRHASILKYYGEDKQDFSCGGNCDNCKCQGTYIKTDGTSDAFNVVQAMLELSGKKINCQTLKLFLIGSSQKSIKDSELDKLTTFGCLRKTFIPSVLLDKFLHSLIYQDVLSETIELKNTALSVLINPGSKAHLVLSLHIDVEKYCKV